MAKKKVVKRHRYFTEAEPVADLRFARTYTMPVLRMMKLYSELDGREKVIFRSFLFSMADLKVRTRRR